MELRLLAGTSSFGRQLVEGGEGVSWMEVAPHIRCMAGSLWKVVRGKLDGSFPSYSLYGRQPVESGERQVGWRRV